MQAEAERTERVDVSSTFSWEDGFWFKNRLAAPELKWRSRARKGGSRRQIDSSAREGTPPRPLSTPNASFRDQLSSEVPVWRRVPLRDLRGRNRSLRDC